MVETSAEWNACYEKRLLPETFIKLQYGITEPGLNAAATLTGTYAESFSTTADLANEQIKPIVAYANLERNSWRLDGSRAMYAVPPVNPGFTSSKLSGSASTFSYYPKVTITFSEVHTVLIPGITITWSNSFNEFAVKFRIQVYNGTTTVLDKTISDNNSVVSVVEQDIQNYDKIVITVMSWCQPYRRARIESIYLGILQIYTKSDLLEYKHEQTVDLLSASLPKNSITFKLDNSDNRWNPDSPTGVYKYLQEMQKIQAEYGMKVANGIEYIHGGTFWLTEWSTTNNKLEASFTARDAIAWMSDDYTGTRSGTLYEIATAAFVQAALENLSDGSPSYQIDESLQNTSVNFSEDTSSYSIAEILQMVAHAGQCLLYQNSKGVMCISPINDSVNSYTIGNFNSFSEPEITLSKPLKAVSVTYGQNTETITVGSTGVTQTVDSPLILTQALANAVGAHAAEVLKGRKTVKGEYRANPCLEAGDAVHVQNRFATNDARITSITYSTTGGGFTGKYEGRIL